VKVPHLFRTGVLIVAAQVAVALLGIVGLRAYTSLVAPVVFGETNLVLSALGLGLQLFVAGFVAAQLRFYSEAETRGAGDRFTRDTLIWSLRATTVLVALTLVIVATLRITGVVAFSAAAVVSGVAWLFGMAIRNVLMSRIQAQRRQAWYANLQVVEAILLFGVTLAALHLVPSVESFLIGQVLAITLFLLIILSVEPRARAVFSLRPTAEPRLTAAGSFGSKAWSYGAPFAPMSFLSWLANLGDRYTLAILLGSGAAGRYIAPFSIASRGMLLANSALCDLFRPVLFDAENRRDIKSVRNAFVGWLISSAALSSAGLAVVYSGGTLIARLLLAPEYRSGAVNIMLWISLGYTVSGITQVLESRVLSLGHSARLLLPMVLGAAANVAFSIVLIRANGIVGAAQATCASFIFQNFATVGLLLHALWQGRTCRAQEAKVEPA
jgi:O-antigen/teichoic acid export membrane protein